MLPLGDVTSGITPAAWRRRRMVLSVVPWFFPTNVAKNYRLARLRKGKTY